MNNLAMDKYSTFSCTHKVGNNGIDTNFVFPHSCHFLYYLYHKMLVNVKLDVIWYLSRLWTLLVFLILNGMAKTMLAILPLLYCGKIVKNSIGQST